MPTPSLPFDVEVHQLPSGERVVVDTHRLLLPDLSWIHSMNDDHLMVPRIFAVVKDEAAAAVGAAAGSVSQERNGNAAALEALAGGGKDGPRTIGDRS